MCQRPRSVRGILLSLCLCVFGKAYSHETLQLQRLDHKPIQAMAYAPTSTTCVGISVISPGAGGTEKGYRYLGETLSALGYLAVVVGHQESGRLAVREHIGHKGLREGLAELITAPDAYRGRFMDIAAAKRWAKDRCKSEESVLIGHSMGAATAMMEAGARSKVKVQGADSFSIYIAMSPQGAGLIFPENAWSNIQKPVLLLTGTQDTELGGASWETRTEPFKNMPPGCKWLGVIDGSSHLNFAGIGLSRNTEALASLTIGNFLNALHRSDCTPPAQVKGMELSTK